MATRSNINVKVGNVYHSIYCHFDGYPSGVGKTLLENYNTQELAEKLVSFGDISSIGESCEKPEGHSYNNPVPGYTVYYGRDRGEEGIGVQIRGSIRDEESYTYVWNGNEWLLNGTEYDNDDNEIEYINTPLTIVLGLEEPENGNDEIEDEAIKVFKYFGCSIDEVIEINNEWVVEFHTPHPDMTDLYNERNKWTVKHRFAPYNGIDEDGNWINVFNGRTLNEAVTHANECLMRGTLYESNNDESGY